MCVSSPHMGLPRPQHRTGLKNAFLLGAVLAVFTNSVSIWKWNLPLPLTEGIPWGQGSQSWCCPHFFLGGQEIGVDPLL